ncbi:MAG: single-stranded-DNA-specific exonuclease RecJ [Acidobacteriota bacterium]
MDYRWRLLSPDADEVSALTRELGLSRLLAALLVNRGLIDPQEVYDFLNPRFEDLHDPYLMKGMAETVARLVSAIERGEKILVHGDYDVDGITSTVVLKRALEMLGGRVDYHIPHRLDDGYGIKGEVLERAAREGVGLVISVDCGIRDFEAADLARELGLDLIVTDHHLPGDVLPRAAIILNPRQPGCAYPDKNLAAVGVVLKIVQALFERSGRSSLVPHFLKVAAIGTVADMVPLTGENRIIVKLGLSALSETYNVGLQALLTGAGIDGSVNHIDVSFRLAPRINAFTRMGGGQEIVDLFSVRDPAEAAAIVQDMNRKNVARRLEEDRILAEIDGQGEPFGDVEAGFIVIGGRDWHRGVLGNVASRIVQRYHRPTLILSLGEQGGQGSGRSIPGFHLLKALEHAASYFERFGGHAQAVGCTLKREYCNAEGLEELRRVLGEYAAPRLSNEMLEPELLIDYNVPVDMLSTGMCSDLERLAPYGVGNPVPVFASSDLVIAGGPWILKDKHLKFSARANGTPLDVIWWRNGQVAAGLGVGQAIQVAYTLGRETFRGEERLVLTVKDLRA